MTLLRCHDTWDRMPEVGIPDSWASFLGFPTEQRKVDCYYKICLLEDVTVEEVARKVLEKVRPLGQDAVCILGNRDKRVSRMAVGTGAITHLPSMLDLEADLLLATDDGMNYWDGGLWALDLGIPLLIVNHATAEKPGMMAMAGYLSDRFPGIPVEYIDVAFPYTTV
jgi:putative NIF3 family GTP cyclohydrolase 1 type 2